MLPVATDRECSTNQQVVAFAQEVIAGVGFSLVGEIGVLVATAVAGRRS